MRSSWNPQHEEEKHFSKNALWFLYWFFSFQLQNRPNFILLCRYITEWITTCSLFWKCALKTPLKCEWYSTALQHIKCKHETKPSKGPKKTLHCILFTCEQEKSSYCGSDRNLVNILLFVGQSLPKHWGSLSLILFLLQFIIWYLMFLF